MAKFTDSVADEKKDKTVTWYLQWLPKKYVIYSACLLVTLVLAASRHNVLMYVMFKHETSNDYHSLQYTICPNTIKHFNQSLPFDHKAEFDWPSSLQTTAEISTKIGILIMAPMGYKTDKFGGKKYLRYALILTSIILFYIPSATRGLEYSFLVLRFVLGLSQGLMFPALHSLLAQWSSDWITSCRTLVISVNAICKIEGIFLSHIMWRLLSVSVKWSHLYYAVGLIVLITWLIMEYTCYSSPATHPYITDLEQLSVMERNNCYNVTSIPLLDILNCAPFRSLLLTNIMFSWLDQHFWVFRKNIMHGSWFDTSDSKFKGEEELMSVAFGVIGGLLSDVMIIFKIPKTIVRKLFAGIGMIGPFACFLHFLYWNMDEVNCYEDRLLTTWYLANTLKGGCFCSILILNLDLSPTYAGTLHAFVLALSWVSTLIAQEVLEVIFRTDTSLLMTKRIVWVEAFIISVAYGQFIWFGNAEIQSWNDFQDEDEGHENEDIAYFNEQILDEMFY